MRDLAEAEPVSSRSHGERRIVILHANFYDVCMLLLPLMGVSSEAYHVNAQAQSVPRESDVPAGTSYSIGIRSHMPPRVQTI
jgi:hypothetical protein